METMAYYAFWSGALLSALTLAAGLAYALAPRLTIGRAATDIGTLEVPVTVSGPAWLKGGSRGMAWAAIAVLTVYLGLRWTASGLPPVSNMWEYTVAFGWVTLLGARLVDWRYRAWGLSLALLAGALALFALAEAAFPSRINLTHVHLQIKHLLALHAGSMLFAFGAFAVAFVAGLGLLIDRLAGRPAWLPARGTLEEIGDRAVLLGFPLYTLGLALGSYWMNSLWGKYWDWDAKASSALATWLIYAAYLHLRGLRRWRERAGAYALVGGFAALMFSYLAVNLW